MLEIYFFCRLEWKQIPETLDKFVHLFEAFFEVRGNQVNNVTNNNNLSLYSVISTKKPIMLYNNSTWKIYDNNEWK